MADIYEPPPEFATRDFKGNPSPAPSTGGLVSLPEAPAPQEPVAPEMGPASASGPKDLSETPSAKSKGTYRVVDTSDGKRKMFYFAPDGQTVDRGEVLAPTAALNTVGTYNQQGKTWDVPEKYALSFERGKPGFVEHIANSFEGAEAGMHSGLVGYLAVTKQMPYDEALAKTETDLVKAQLTAFPKLAWGDSKLQNIVAASKWALGAAAEVLPSQIGNLKEGIAVAPKMALGATAVAAAGGPPALAALATPPVLMSVAGVSWQYGAFDFTSKVTTGSMALDMKRKGIDEKTIEMVAPIAGMFAGSLEIMHVKYLPAPWRRAVVGKIFNNPVAKKAMLHWAMNYFKETGAEVGVEVAQQYIENFGTNMMASMDNRPDVHKDWKTMNAEAGAVALKTAVGMGLIKAPGMVFEAAAGGESKPKAAGVESAPKTSAEAVANGVAAGIRPALSVAETGKPFEYQAFRGDSGKKTDAGDYGKGTYSTGDLSRAEAYGKVSTVPVRLENPLVFKSSKEARDFRRKVVGAELLDNPQSEVAALKMHDAIRSLGHDGVVVYDSEGNFTAVPDKPFEIVALGEVHKYTRAKAPAVEAALVAETPEVAAVLTELNSELDPNSEFAAEEYSAVGEDLMGNENAQAAVAAKIEALRSEMSDIVSEEDNTPSEQRRVAEIQNEISLLDGMKSKMEGPAVFDEEFVDGSSIPDSAPLNEKPVTGAKKRVEAQILKARETRVASEINNNLTMVKELEAAKTRLEKAGKSTEFIQDKIDKLMGAVYALDEKRAASEGAAKTDILELKQATLDSITKAAFREGRKDVVVRRASLLNDAAAEHGLSDRDVKSLTKNRNLGIMSDFDFKRYIDEFRVKAAELAQRKQALVEVHRAQDAKNLKHEESLRRINGLPPVSKMTAEQMRQYAELVEGYEAGETFWTPARIDALKNTQWSGAETMEDVLRMAAKQFNVPLEGLTKISLSEFDRWKYDTALARSHPLFNFMVDTVKLAGLKQDMAYFAAREEHFKLAEAAAESRAALDKGKKGVWDRIKNWAAPQQAEVMAYIEAAPEDKAAIGANLTPEEIALAEYEIDFYQKALDYLIQSHDLENTRFADGTYVMHARRPLSEVLRDVGETGIKAAVSDIMGQWTADKTNFVPVDQKTGAPLGLRKFFRQTLFRSGELTPSKNVVRSTDIYMRQFFKKKALDESVPAVQTLTMAVASMNKTPEGKQMGDAVKSFVSDYLNAKKGKSAITGIVQGGKIDALLNFASSALSLFYMGGNSLIQLASPVGETAAKVPVLGIPGLAKATYRGHFTKQGKAIVAKYKYFTGEGVIEEFTQPGQNLETRIMMMAYGIFKWSRVNTMRDLILGSMTPEEFSSGTISNERLAQIKKIAGRWIDVGDAKSIMGTTSLVKSETQFKSWAIPIMSSATDILGSAINSARGKKGGLTPLQKTEVARVLQTMALVGLAAALSGKIDPDDDTYMGRLKAKVYREMTTLAQAVDPATFLSGPASLAWLIKVAQNIRLAATLEETKRTGENKGLRALKMQLTPAVVKQFSGPKKKKKAGVPEFKQYKRKD